MVTILSIETSTTVCSVALSQDGKQLSIREVNAGYSHSEKLTVFIDEVCKEGSVELNNVDAVAVSKGPGSYTGLRIGISTAKGLCYALDKPLIAIDTLKSLANCFQLQTLNHKHQTLLLPMLDARRMEVYCSVFDSKLNEILPVAAVVIDENSFSELLSTSRITFFGDGSPKCKLHFQNNPNALFADVQLSAKGMISLAEEKFQKKEFEDVSLFEPFYLKEAAVGKAVK